MKTKSTSQHHQGFPFGTDDRPLIKSLPKQHTFYQVLGFERISKVFNTAIVSVIGVVVADHA